MDEAFLKNGHFREKWTCSFDREDEWDMFFMVNLYDKEIIFWLGKYAFRAEKQLISREEK